MRLPVISAKKLCTFLEQEGFEEIRQKGSHRFYRHQDGRTVIVPIHTGRPIGRGLLSAILGEINMSRDGFIRKYKK